MFTARYVYRHTWAIVRVYFNIKIKKTKNEFCYIVSYSKPG